MNSIRCRTIWAKSTLSTHSMVAMPLTLTQHPSQSMVLTLINVNLCPLQQLKCTIRPNSKTPDYSASIRSKINVLRQLPTVQPTFVNGWVCLLITTNKSFLTKMWINHRKGDREEIGIVTYLHSTELKNSRHISLKHLIWWMETSTLEHLCWTMSESVQTQFSLSIGSIRISSLKLQQHPNLSWLSKETLKWATLVM